MLNDGPNLFGTNGLLDFGKALTEEGLKQALEDFKAANPRYYAETMLLVSLRKFSITTLERLAGMARAGLFDSLDAMPPDPPAARKGDQCPNQQSKNER